MPGLAAVGEAVRTLGCRFVTTDVGDGQVSDLPSGADAMELFTALAGF